MLDFGIGWMQIVYSHRHICSKHGDSARCRGLWSYIC